MLLHAIMIILYGAEEHGVPADQIPGQVITLLPPAQSMCLLRVFVTPRIGRSNPRRIKFYYYNRLRSP